MPSKNPKAREPQFNRIEGVAVIKVKAEQEAIDALFANIQEQVDALNGTLEFAFKHPPTPNDLLTSLHNRPSTLTQLAEKFDMSEPEVQFLINMLLEDKLVMDTTKGKDGEKTWELTFKGLKLALSSNPQMMEDLLDKWEAEVPGTKARIKGDG